MKIGTITVLEAADELYDLQTDWFLACKDGRGSPGLRAAAEALRHALDALWLEAGRNQFHARRES